MAATTFVRVADAHELARPGSRKHVEVRERFVSLIRGRDGVLHCLDAVCYHAGGPLTVGDIEEVNGSECVKCPWHDYPVRLADGGKPYKPMDFEGGKLVPKGWAVSERRQRVHEVAERPDGLYVRLTSEVRVDRHAEDAEFESDKWAYNESAAANVFRHGVRQAGAAGSDGKLVRMRNDRGAGSSRSD